MHGKIYTRSVDFVVRVKYPFIVIGPLGVAVEVEVCCGCDRCGRWFAYILPLTMLLVFARGDRWNPAQDLQLNCATLLQQCGRSLRASSLKG